MNRCTVCERVLLEGERRLCTPCRADRIQSYLFVVGTIAVLWVLLAYPY